MSTLTELFTDIADAIREKKGTTDSIVASNFPSEIATIEAGGGTEITGAEDATVMATENISKNYICSLIPVPELGYEGKLITNLPLAYTQAPPLIMDNGNFVLSCDTSYRYWPFYLVNGEYKPLKVNGVSTYWGQYSSTNQPDRSYDAYTKKYYKTSATSTTLNITEYTIDVENLNLVEGQTYSCEMTNASTYLGLATFSYRKNIFIQWRAGSASSGYESLQFHISDDGVLTKIGSVNDNIDKITSTADRLYGTNFIVDKNEDLIVFVTKYGANNYVLKYTYNSGTGIYNEISNYMTMPEGTEINMAYAKYFTNRAPSMYMGKDNDFIIRLDSNKQIVMYTVSDTFTLLGTGGITFDDGFSNSNITRISFSRNANLLFILSGSTSYTTAQQTRLYKVTKSGTTLNCEFIGCPTETFDTVLASAAIPIQQTFDDPSRSVIISSTNNWYGLYDIHKIIGDYEYTATNSNNSISSNESVTAYAVAKEDIAEGEIGRASLILSK